MHESEVVKNPEDISLSLRIGLDADDHLALHGIKRTSTQGKRILEKFNEGVIESSLEIIHEGKNTVEQNIENDSDDSSTSNQFSLNDF
jgi:hypothetical protein